MEQRNFTVKFKERLLHGVYAEINGKDLFLPYSQLTSFEKFKAYVLERMNFLCYIEEPQEKNFADLINEAFSEATYKGLLDYREDIIEALKESSAKSLFDVLQTGESLILPDRIVFTFDFLKSKLKERGIALSEHQLSRILIFDLGATKKRYTIKAGDRVFSKVIWELDLKKNS